MKAIRIFLILFIAMAASGCTQNGGHIGKLFGRWHLDAIEADGCAAPERHGDIYWAFQSDVIQMMRENAPNDFSTIFGLFRLDDNTLFIDFPEAAKPTQTDGKPPFPETGLPRESRLQVLKLTGKEMVLLYQATPQGTLTYRLRKI